MNMIVADKTVHAARGKWRGILMALGMPESFLRNRHGPCPLCGGKDRFRFDNRDSAGTWICSHCGAGDGMDLAMRFTGREFRDVANEVDAIVCRTNFPTDRPRERLTDEKRRALLNDLWSATAPITADDLAGRYLAGRGITHIAELGHAIRYGASVRDGEGAVRPCMVSVVRDSDGIKRSLHRTFLGRDGRKAEMERVRRMMPGDLPDSVAVRLCDWQGGPLGVAEGIETALSASQMFEMPVWATTTAGFLAKWRPPAGCTEVAVFGDHDASFTGHAAAYALARALKAKEIDVTVHIPDQPGDWNDVLMRRKP